MTCPTDHTHGANGSCYRNHRCRCDSCRATNAARSRANQAGLPWPEPDPYAVDFAVEGMRVYMTGEQRVEAVRRLWSQRWSDRAIAEQLGITDRTVIRIRQRAGLRGWQMSELQKMKEAA